MESSEVWGGPDGIRLKILKELMDTTSRPLSINYQRSWESGEVPTDWKLTTIIKNYKKGMRKENTELLDEQYLEKLWIKLYRVLLKGI